MRALRIAAAAVAAVAALSGPLAASASVSDHAAAAAVGGTGLAAAGAAAGNGCYTVGVPPQGYIVVCSYGSGRPGSGGPGGGSQKVQCTLQMLSPNAVRFLGLPAPPAGEKWAAITCPGAEPFNGVTLVSKGGAPLVTPQELLQIALGELQVPALLPGTAPPLGDRGLVGLPEWYWIPAADWHPLSVYVSAGPVWADLVATPAQLTFEPGGGLGSVSCAGPGTQYSVRAAARAHPCTFTYTQSSALQPGGAYQAAVVVTWRVSWTGSGGAGGTLDAGLQVPYGFALRIAEGQALVTGR